MAKQRKEAGRASRLGGPELASERLVKSFNDQIGHEMHASFQYVAIAAHFASENLPQLAGFFYRQAEEERAHAMKFVHFLVEIGARVRVPGVAAPRAEFATAEEAVALSLEWEKSVTQQIYALVDISKEDGNYIALRFLDWFVSEQLEELNTMGGLLAVIQRAGEGGLLFVESQLAGGRGAGTTGAPSA